ncbi:MAG: hypothetical protein Q4D53_06525, partial [Leptotrichiaceae bacterium]|nr:hypothetical protein [Leptotrichiaceae bacterium]
KRSSIGENKNSDKFSEFMDKIREYSKLKAEKKNYDKYNKKYMTYADTKKYEDEIRKIDIQTDIIRKEISQFTNVLLSNLWEDYEHFKDFVQEGENLRTLAELTEFNSIFEELDEINIFENHINIRNRVENYFEELEQFDFSISDEKDNKSSIENVLRAFDKENDIINLMMHFTYANILIRNNIMKYPLISEEYKENSDIMQEIKALKYDMLNYYRNSLTYRNNIKIDDEITENYSDALFYDLLYLQYNRENSDEKSFMTFDNLDSTRINYKTDPKGSTLGITVDGDSVTINCSINDFIQISNSLELIGKLKEEDIQKNFLTFLYKDNEYYKNKKFKLKSKFMSERENVLKKMENLTEIEEELLKKGMKLISTERRLLFRLLGKTENETESFKSAMMKVLKDPLFIEKIIKAESVEKNGAYRELYIKITGGEENGKKTL